MVEGLVKVVVIYLVGIGFFKSVQEYFEQLFFGVKVLFEYQCLEQVVVVVVVGFYDVGIILYFVCWCQVCNWFLCDECMVVVCVVEYLLVGCKLVKVCMFDCYCFVGFEMIFLVFKVIGWYFKDNGVCFYFVNYVDNIDMMKSLFVYIDFVVFFLECMVFSEVDVGMFVSVCIELVLVWLVGVVFVYDCLLMFVVFVFIDFFV